MRQKIEKYQSNSRRKLSLEPERREFHHRNMIEFEKYLDFDLDFGKTRNFE
jgi:hypothetical protein